MTALNPKEVSKVRIEDVAIAVKEDLYDRLAQGPCPWPIGSCPHPMACVCESKEQIKDILHKFEADEWNE